MTPPVAHALRRFDSARAIPLAFVLLAGSAVENAEATALSWKMASSGNAGIAANWLPSQVPVNADMLTFHVGGAYNVTFDASADTATSHFYRSGLVTVITSGTHQLLGQLRVGDVAGDVGGLTLTTGTLRSAANIVIANAGGSSGTLTVEDDDADLLQTGISDVLVGNGGQGTLRILEGGLVTASDDVVAGGSSASQGTILVSGVNAAPVVRSTLQSSGADGDLVFGNGGSATVTIGAGAQAISTDDVFIALTSASTSSVTVEGGGGGFPSQLTAAGDLDLARNATASAAGTGTLIVQNQGGVSVTGAARVGDANGGTGTLRVRANSTFSAHDLLVDPAHGVLDHQGGQITVDGGVFDPPGATLVLSDLGFERVRLQNGATATFDGGSSIAYSVIVGDNGPESGGLALDTNAHLTHVNGVLAVGLAPGSSGELDITNSALLDGAGSIMVGLGGFGVMNLGGGADLNLTDMAVGYAVGSNGFVDVAGSGTTLTLDRLAIGGHGVTAGGPGLVEVRTGGAIVFDGAASNPLFIGAPGTLRVHATGTVTNEGGATADVRGQLLMNGGQVEFGTVSLFDASVIEGFGTIDANIAGSSAPNAVIRSTGGPLVLGQSSSDKGFFHSGTLICNSGAPVTLRDLDAVQLGNVVLNNGTLNLPAGGGTIQPGKTMSGAGTVTGTLTNTGIVSPGSSAGTITFGTYTQGAGGRLTLEIGDAATNQYDRIVTTGAANLAGTLDIRILPGYVPNDGESFLLVSAAPRFGTFSAVTLEGLPVNMQFNIVYGPSIVTLQVNHITTDVPPLPEELPREIAFVGRSGSSANAGFELALPEASRVAVRLYDPAGRAIGTLFDGDAGAGTRPLRLGDLDRVLPGGVYFARATIRTASGETRRSAKVTLVN